ncbi:unnamed protein product [Effrenium voratum]|nr:unnamed protein product [Effrenium voratum]
MDGALLVEVKQGTGLQHSAYRFGDILSSALGARRIRPFISCRVLWANQRTTEQQTPYVEAGNGAFALWNHTLVFPLSAAFWKTDSFKVSFEARDKRELQGALRGDSLIGCGELQVDLQQMGDRQVTLRDAQGHASGELRVTLQLRAPEEALRVMSRSSSTPLAQAARAFAQTLHQSNALQRLKEARPERLDAGVNSLLESWLARFRKKGLGLSGRETDDEAINSLWQVARSAQEMIACYAQPGEDIPGIAVHWLKNYFSRCTGAEAELNETRLRALLTMHQVDVSGQNPWDRLREIGATLSGVEDAVALVLANRLEEAKRGAEEETFTQEEIIQKGRLIPGIAMVLRRDTAAQWGCHAFLYDHASIVQWQAVAGFARVTEMRKLASTATGHVRRIIEMGKSPNLAKYLGQNCQSSS